MIKKASVGSFAIESQKPISLLMLRGSVIRLLIALFALLLWHRWVGEIRQRIVPEIMIEPGEVVLHDGAHRPGLGNRMAEAFVDDHLDADTFVLQCLS